MSQAVMTTFEFVRPVTLDEALDELAQDGSVALAGGTDLVPMRVSRVIDPARIVDLKSIEELNVFVVRDDGARIGAAVTMRRAGQLAGCTLAALADGASIVGSALTRNRATVGGNVCRSSPAGDTLPSLLVLGAKAHIASSSRRREVEIADFFTGPGQNVLEAGEILVSLAIPRATGASAYRRLTYRKWMDLAVVGVAAWIELDAEGRCRDAAVAFGGGAPTPRLVPAASAALRGTGLDDAALGRAAAAVVDAASPIDDVRGSASHRLRGLEVLTRRVINDAKLRTDGTQA